MSGGNIPETSVATQSDSVVDGLQFDASSGEQGELAAPAAAQPELTLEALAKKLHSVELMARRLITRDAARRAKTMALQSAFVKSFGLKYADINDPAASIFPIEISRNPNARARVLAFGSMGDNMGMTSREFFKVLEPQNVEIIFLKDFEQCWYLKGLLGLSSNIPETAEVIRGILAERSLPTLALGASSGGFAAILFGALLGVESVLAFSPQTEVTKRVVNRFQSVDSDAQDIDVMSQYGDLVKVLAETAYVGKMEVFFSERADFDRDQAKRLAGIPCVKLNSLNWTGHNTAAFLKSRSKLDETIAEALNFG